MCVLELLLPNWRIWNWKFHNNILAMFEKCFIIHAWFVIFFLVSNFIYFIFKINEKKSNFTTKVFLYVFMWFGYSFNLLFTFYIHICINFLTIFLFNFYEQIYVLFLHLHYLEQNLLIVKVCNKFMYNFISVRRLFFSLF